MSDDIVCPNCARDAHLTGERHGDLIRITCAACNLVWDRDPAPRCPTCGADNVRPVPEAIWAKSRGNQLSTIALRTVYLCPACDAERLFLYLNSGSPLPPTENPAGGPR